MTHLGKWAPWFAWHPVFVGDSIVWLETIDRLVTVDGLGFTSYYNYEYRLKYRC